VDNKNPWRIGQRKKMEKEEKQLGVSWLNLFVQHSFNSKHLNTRKNLALAVLPFLK
jgi:hypothetical protein